MKGPNKDTVNLEFPLSFKKTLTVHLRIQDLQN